MAVQSGSAVSMHFVKMPSGIVSSQISLPSSSEIVSGRFFSAFTCGFHQLARGQSPREEPGTSLTAQSRVAESGTEWSRKVKPAISSMVSSQPGSSSQVWSTSRAFPADRAKSLPRRARP